MPGDAVPQRATTEDPDTGRPRCVEVLQYALGALGLEEARELLLGGGDAAVDTNVLEQRLGVLDDAFGAESDLRHPVGADLDGPLGADVLAQLLGECQQGRGVGDVDLHVDIAQYGGYLVGLSQQTG